MCPLLPHSQDAKEAAQREVKVLQRQVAALRRERDDARAEQSFTASDARAALQQREVNAAEAVRYKEQVRGGQAAQRRAGAGGSVGGGALVNLPT